MKYKFKLIVFMTYYDEDLEVEIDLSDKEVTQIKKLVAGYEPDTNLLQILEDKDPKLFDKFWGVVYKPVFVELLIDGMENYGSEIQHDDDPIDDPQKYRRMPFNQLYNMYGNDIDLDYSSSCFCKIPEKWKK